MNFIKKVWENKTDELVHLQFQKFSKGEFRSRALVKAKKTGNKYSIATSAEFGNELVLDLAKKLGSKTANVKGVIVSTNELNLEYTNKKQFMGIKQYGIDKDMSGNEIVSLMERFPKAFFGLSFSIPEGNTSLKIKPKAPKSAKPSTKGEEDIKPDFCKLVTEDAKLGESFIWEKPNFKTAEITHTFMIDEIVVPPELRNEKDFAKVREGAKRKGRII
ncbi:MAG TPA: hypothetical protein VMC80_03560, partial [Patescibacteria group bacterium]|nr:hypothetical protein [Patescibacteria group bacterium]